jgi:putative transposase
MARLFIEVLLHYRQHGKYLLHEFVLMPNHFHLLITPVVTLERALQHIKGGFSFRAGKELGFGSEIWQTSFYDRRVRDMQEYRTFAEYIRLNPVKRELRVEYPYCSARLGFVLDGIPQRLKPLRMTA